MLRNHFGATMDFPINKLCDIKNLSPIDSILKIYEVVILISPGRTDIDWTTTDNTRPPRTPGTPCKDREVVQVSLSKSPAA